MSNQRNNPHSIRPLLCVRLAPRKGPCICCLFSFVRFFLSFFSLRLASPPLPPCPRCSSSPHPSLLHEFSLPPLCERQNGGHHHHHTPHKHSLLLSLSCARAGRQVSRRRRGRKKAREGSITHALVCVLLPLPSPPPSLPSSLPPPLSSQCVFKMY